MWLAGDVECDPSRWWRRGTLYIISSYDLYGVLLGMQCGVDAWTSSDRAICGLPGCWRTSVATFYIKFKVHMVMTGSSCYTGNTGPC